MTTQTPTLTIALVTGGSGPVLDALFADPVWQRLTNVGPVTVAAMLVERAKQIAMTDLIGVIGPQIDGAYEDYLAVNGLRDPNNYGDWDEGLDDAIANLFEPYSKYLSAQWMGIHLIDTRMHNEGEALRLANLFATEVWAQLTYQRTNNQILSGVGITEPDIMALVESKAGAMIDVPPPPPPMEYNPMSVNAVLNKVIMYMPDMTDLRDNLEQASDSDDALSHGGAERLGLDWPDVLILRDAKSRSRAALDAWVNAIEAGQLLEVDKTYV